MMNREHQSLSRRERKRLRDRQAQQFKRQKRESHVRELEAQVAFCQRHHQRVAVNSLDTVERLRRENTMLQQRLEQVRRVVTLTSDAPVHQSEASAFPTDPCDNHDANNRPWLTSLLPQLSSQPSETARSACFAANPETSYEQNRIGFPLHSDTPSLLPPWSLIPMNEYGSGHVYPQAICPWLSHVDLIARCPPVPCPLDLLYGSRQNYLADRIHRALRDRYFRDPECLASGWLSYVFTKWLVSPSPAAFDRLPPLLRPTRTQILESHPCAVDLIMWPRLRVNLIEKWTQIDFAELAGYLCCCVKVRWPWGREFLERDHANNIQMTPEFFHTFTQEGGWGLTSEFVERYPELVRGCDVETIQFRLNLP